MDKRIESLKAFLDYSVSGYHAIAGIAEMLDQQGYKKLYEHQDWLLVPGGKYYMIRGGSTLIAFRIPVGEPSGFILSASHSDRPGFTLK